MSGWARARIQLCGRFVVDVDGTRIEDSCPAAEGVSFSPTLSSTAAVQCPAVHC